ncbi:hypothetical protein N836_31720 [Leptolyngbya sp. Heron Island J]|uniref:hypothetical protein n=1 Tax=Leptolyngbya sp. Heron Island J TaxID=1385935 RepID=UPI0003B97E9A|nr:hypothetical protein [Leptolyngbya sp. Heron Island J]ESA38511.1 hypothetical protein N836_31720 [Leptolyngbya sp. Heron Island J]
MTTANLQLTLEELAFIHGLTWEHFVFVSAPEGNHTMIQGLLQKLQVAAGASEQEAA